MKRERGNRTFLEVPVCTEAGSSLKLSHAGCVAGAAGRGCGADAGAPVWPSRVVSNSVMG